jgi:hypothetical protein
MRHFERSIASPVEPEVKISKDMVCQARCLEGGVFECVEDEGIFLEKRLREGRDFCLLNLAVPLLENIYEEVELVVRREKRMRVELPQLEGRVLLALEELSYLRLHCLPRVLKEDCL